MLKFSSRWDRELTLDERFARVGDNDLLVNQIYPWLNSSHRFEIYCVQTHNKISFTCMFICRALAPVYRLLATVADARNEMHNDSKRPNKWKLCAKAFYISDEKFVFYTRMECWLWNNILIEMIHYTFGIQTLDPNINAWIYKYIVRCIWTCG